MSWQLTFWIFYFWLFDCLNFWHFDILTIWHSNNVMFWHFDILTFCHFWHYFDNFPLKIWDDAERIHLSKSLTFRESVTNIDHWAASQQKNLCFTLNVQYCYPSYNQLDLSPIFRKSSPIQTVCLSINKCHESIVFTSQITWLNPVHKEQILNKLCVLLHK